VPLYFSFSGTVWKILCDSASPIIAVELRDHEIREVNFALINTEQGKIIWQGNNPEELWWTGIEAFKNNRLFLHGYKDIQFPEHKRLWAFSEKGIKLWVDKGLTFLGFSGDSLYGFKNGEGDAKRFYELDAATGKVKKEISAEVAMSILNTADVNNYVENPIHYKADNQYYPRLAAFIEQLTGLKAVVAIDYLEYKNKIIISFYTIDNEKLASRIVIVSEDGVKEAEELTGTELSGIGIDTFFVFRDILFFVKNKKELVLHYI